MKVNVYRNVKKTPSTLSIRCASSGLVLGHAHHAELSDCKFVIQLAGQARVRETHHKNVHAWITGTLEYVTDFESIKDRELDNDVLHITEEDLQLVKEVTEDSPKVFQLVTSPVTYKLVDYNPDKYDNFILTGTDIPVKTSEASSVYCDGTIYAREPKP